MTDRFSTPTREQLARIVNGDTKLLRAFELIFFTVGQSDADRFEAIETRLDLTERDIKSNEVLLWLSM